MPSLRIEHPSKFIEWIGNMGFVSEKEFWGYFANNSTGTEIDCLEDYLGQLGYTGTTDDKFKTFLIDQIGHDGTFYDLANEFMNNIYSVEDGYLTTEDGTIITTEDGEKIIL